MKRLIHTSILAFASLTLAAPHLAAAGPRRGKRLERMADELGLDAGTKARIRQVFIQTRAEAKPLRQRLRTERRALRRLLRADNATEAAVLAQADKLGALKLQLKKIRLKAMLRVRQLLTPAQRQKLRELRRSRHRAVRAACSADVAKLCNSSGGEGRWKRKRCLLHSYDKLSAQCKQAIGSRFHHHRGH